ncbi:MAG: hypothetical protein WC421_05030 [Elusimicrobiales bacterium]
MPDIEIREIQEREISAFVDFQYELYKNDPYWIGDLKSSVRALLSLSHPFWKHAERKLWLACRQGRPVARIAAIINQTHNDFHNEKTGFFGFFETANDAEAARALVLKAEGWLKESGMDRMRGPVNPSTNDMCGLLISGFDSYPKVMMPYNPPYYGEMLEGCGLSKIKDLHAYIRFSEQPLSERIEKIISRIQTRKDWRAREIRLSDLGRELETVREIYNDAWSENWGFVPISREEMAFAAKELRPVLKPKYGCIIEVDNRPAAFSIVLPDINQALRPLRGELNPLNFIKLLVEMRRIRQSRLLMLGVRKEFRSRGFELILIKHAINTARECGWLHGELSWILEDNYKIISVIEEIGGRLYKKYRIYSKEFYEQPPMLRPEISSSQFF